MTSISDVRVKVTADTSKAVSELGKLERAVAAIGSPKAGVRTSEMYAALFTVADNLVLARFHNDWGLQANEAVVLGVVSSVVGSVYVAARTWLKGRHAGLATALVGMLEASKPAKAAPKAAAPKVAP